MTLKLCTLAPLSIKHSANINKKINQIANKKIAFNSHFICVY